MDSVTQGDVLDLPATSGGALPRLATGTELLGQYKDSAYEDPRFLIRRADGQVMQLPGLLYRVAGSLDGRDARQVAADLNAELGLELTAEQIVFLVEDRLRPVGVLAPDVEDPALPDDERADRPDMPVRSDLLLSLRHRAPVVPANVAWRVAGFFRPLFFRPVWVGLVAAFLAVDIWIVGHDVLGRFVAGVEQITLQPVLILAVFGITIVSGAFHECGHASACRYGGARPGNLGVGLYILWPAFYSTVTDSYRLNRVGRIRTDLGGIYFNTISLLGLGLVYVGTDNPWLLIALAGLHLQTAWQFLPNLRLDGYYILADLVGVPDLFGFVKPALLSLLPGRPMHAGVRQLKPWARRWIQLWVLLVVPSLIAWLVVFVLAAPHVLPAAWQGTQEYVEQLDAAARNGDVVTTTIGALQLLFLALPWIGFALILWPLTRMLTRRLARLMRLPAVPAPTAAVRRGAALSALGALGVLVVVRVASVAWSHPAATGESRMVDSALAVIRGTTGPRLGPDELPLRAQLIGYAQLTGAFDRHASVLTGGRELVVVAVGVLVVSMVALAATRLVRPIAVGLALAAVLLAGPAVTVLATVSPGVVGAAWTALGTLILVLAGHRAWVIAGITVVAVGVVTAPLIAVPLAVTCGLLLATRERPESSPARHAAAVLARATHAESGRHDFRRWFAVLLVLPVGGFVVTLGSGYENVSLGGAEQTVLLLLCTAVVAAGLLVPRVRRAAAVAASAVALAVPPWPGAGVAAPIALSAVVLLGVLLVDALGDPSEQRTHPLVRGAVAVPILVLTIAAALFQPLSAPALAHASLAGWITGPSADGGTVGVSDALWGDLVRDGVPPNRLVLPADESAGDAAWIVGVGGGVRPDAAAEVTFGRGAHALVVQASDRADAEARRQQEAEAAQRLADEAQRRVDEAQAREEAEQVALRQAAGTLLVRSVRFSAPPDVDSALLEGTVDARVIAALSQLTGIHGVAIGSFPQPGDGSAAAVLVTGLDGVPASRGDVASTVTGLVQELPPAIAPSQVLPGPDGVFLVWSSVAPDGGAG
jgi:putative peptide zinc metalloprotease protein